MGLNISNGKNDYSTLLSSLSKNDNTGFSLSDYASIKNGSYGKLTKAYYKKNSVSANKKAASISDEEKKNLTSVKTAADGLKSAVNNISKSLIESGDKEKIADAVKDFAGKYNSLVSSINTAGDKKITKTAQNMVNAVGANLKLLSRAGITLDKDGKMSVNETAVKENFGTLSSLFGTTGSVGDQIANRASAVASKATSAMNVRKTYNSAASYDTTTDIGKLMDSNV